MDTLGLSVRITITEGTRADCTEACYLIDEFEADFLLADKGYDTDEIINKVENAFLHLKWWRDIATRYTKKGFVIPRGNSNSVYCVVVEII